VRGGHAQTLLCYLFGGARYPYQATQRIVDLPDGDQIVLHDDCPDSWRTGDPAALLIHGLAGCHRSAYMVRAAVRLGQAGVRTFRMDMRGCGAGFLLAIHPMHSGRTEDVDAALVEVARWCPGSPITLIGYSLGGNLALNAVAKVGRLHVSLRNCVAVCPPVDLATCSREMQRGLGRHYDRYFTRLLLGQLAERRKKKPHAPDVRIDQRPRTLWQFDDSVTAPLGGFDSAEHYYAETSSGPHLAKIDVPTRIVADRHDPMVPFHSIEAPERSPAVRLLATQGAGHLGFLGRRGNDPDRRWLDWRLVEWTTGEQ
jgi:hypothetical protein